MLLVEPNGYVSGMTMPTSIEPRPRFTSSSWWFRSSDGRLAVWQFPNPALWVWFAAIALGLLDLSGAHTTAVDGVRHGALLAWALDEVVRGASPFRRALGTVVLVGQVVSLALS